MKLNHDKNIVFSFILAITLIMSGCANKKTNDFYENNDIAVSSSDSGSMFYADEDAILNHNVFHFNFDSSTILEADYQFLDSCVEYYLTKGKDDQIAVHGHTDQVGTRSYNLALGERRANSIKDYLVKQGIAPFRIEVISYGFEKPVMPGFTKEACAANRRVEILKR
jgi:peptidoglycan-associated lipoprotein